MFSSPTVEFARCHGLDKAPKEPEAGCPRWVALRLPLDGCTYSLIACLHQGSCRVLGGPSGLETPGLSPVHILWDMTASPLHVVTQPQQWQCPCGMLGLLGSRAHAGLCSVCVSVCLSCEGDLGRQGCLLSSTVPSKTKAGPPALPLLCPGGAWLVQGSPERLLSRLSHKRLILAQLAMEFYCCSRGLLVEKSWEELPAHPSHTELAFMKSLKQQILPGTCVGVGVKDGLSKIPAPPACACFLLAHTEPLLGWPKGCPFPDSRVPLATLQCACLPTRPTSQLDRGGCNHD